MPGQCDLRGEQPVSPEETKRERSVAVC